MVHKIGHTSEKLYPAAITPLSWWKKKQNKHNKQTKQTKKAHQGSLFVEFQQFSRAAKGKKLTIET